MRKTPIAATIVLLCGLGFGATAKTKPPDISGTWRVDLDLSHGADKWDKTYRVVITQSDDEIALHYFARDGRDLGTDKFVADGVERPRWKTHIEHAYATVRWRGNKLLIDTCSVQSSYFNQMYYTYDAWEIGEEDTLRHKVTDGKVMIFRREGPRKTPGGAALKSPEEQEW